MPEETLRLLKADRGPPFYFLFYVHCLLHRISLQYIKNSNLGLLKVSSGHKSYPGENLNRNVSTDAAVIYSGLGAWEQKGAMLKSAQLYPAWGRGVPRETLPLLLLSQPSSHSFPQLSQIPIHPVAHGENVGILQDWPLAALTLSKPCAHWQSVTGSAVQLAAHHHRG